MFIRIREDKDWDGGDGAIVFFVEKVFVSLRGLLLENGRTRILQVTSG